MVEVSPETRRRLRVVAAEHDLTMRDLLAAIAEVAGQAVALPEAQKTIQELKAAKKAARGTK